MDDGFTTGLLASTKLLCAYGSLNIELKCVRMAFPMILLGTSPTPMGRSPGHLSRLLEE
jgi:hypothetical protein